MKKYEKVAVGGTFDKLHRGHKALLSKAFEIGEKVVIGLSSDEFASKMGKPHKTASYPKRLKELETFLEKNGLTKRAEIVPLNDPYGLTISGKDLDALVLEENVEKVAEAFKQVLPSEKVIVSKIDFQGAKLVGHEKIRESSSWRNI